MNFRFAKLLEIAKNRYFSSGSVPFSVTKLDSKGLLKIHGSDSLNFLQSLTTNDFQLLANNKLKSLYTLFLNNKGRILYDTIVYRLADDSYYLEYDRNRNDSLLKHLEFYKLRKSIEINDQIDQFSIYHLFTDGQTVCPESRSGLFCFADPRLKQLGYRLLVRKSCTLPDIFNEDQKTDYKQYRYSLAIAEGADEIKPDKYFAYELNADRLNAISLTKGCYLGQELTARTFHTGVIRKRLVRINFTDTIENFRSGELLTIENQSIGQVISVYNRIGLAICKLSAIESDANSEIKFRDRFVRVSIPDWLTSLSQTNRKQNE